MKRNKINTTRARSLSWRAFSFSLAVYVFGMATTILSVDNQVLYYAGLCLMAVGAIAVATLIVDGLRSVSSGLITAIILAILGGIIYTVWVGA